MRSSIPPAPAAGTLAKRPIRAPRPWPARTASISPACADATADLSLLLDHVEGREGQPVADPYFGDDDGFDLTWADVTAGAHGLARKLRRGD